MFLHVTPFLRGVVFGVPDRPGIADFLGCYAEVCCRRSKILARNVAILIPAVFLNLAPLLRGAKFVGQPHLGEGLDLERVGLGAVDPPPSKEKTDAPLPRAPVSPWVCQNRGEETPPIV